MRSLSRLSALTSKMKTYKSKIHIFPFITLDITCVCACSRIFISKYVFVSQMRIMLTDIFLPHRLFLLPCWRRSSNFAAHQFWPVLQAPGHLPLLPQHTPQRRDIFALWTHGTLCVWLFYGTWRCFNYNMTCALLKKKKACILWNHIQKVTGLVGAQIWSRHEIFVTSKEH